MSPYTIQNILVPVDLSESSFNALDTAIAIAKKHKAMIYVLNIEETGHGIDDTGNSFYPYSANAADVLSALIGGIQHNHGVKPKLLQDVGHVTDMIIQASLQHQCDLIVIGAHGASGYRDGFIGSNTYSVIKHAACPVLSVPVKRKFNSFKKILFPIRPVSGGLMRYDIVCHFANANTTLDVLGLSYRMVETDTGILKTIVSEVEEQLEKDKVKTNVSWGDGSMIADNVLAYANRNSPDLIVVTAALDVTSKPKFVGPHTQKIVNCAKTSVLSIKKVGVASLA